MRRHYFIDVVFALIILAMAALATVAWGSQQPAPARTLETLTPEPEAAEGVVEDLLAACTRQATAAASKIKSPTDAARLQSITMCTCMGGLPVVLASPDWRSGGIGCARSLDD